MVPEVMFKASNRAMLCRLPEGRFREDERHGQRPDGRQGLAVSDRREKRQVCTESHGHSLWFSGLAGTTRIEIDFNLALLRSSRRSSLRKTVIWYRLSRLSTLSRALAGNELTFLAGPNVYTTH